MKNIKFYPEPVKWLLLEDEFFGTSIYIESRKQENGKYKYAVTSGTDSFLLGTVGFCTSSRSDENFRNKTRHSTFKKAEQAFQKYVKHVISRPASNFYQMAIQYKFNNKVVKTNSPQLLEKIKLRKDK